MPLPKIEGAAARFAVAFLLLTQAVLLVSTARSNSETVDEPMYLLASRSYWATGDFSFNREHPPLSKLLIGAPLAMKGMQLPAEYHTDGATQLRFLYELNDDPVLSLFLGRLPMIGVGLLLSFYVFLFARRMGGDRAGVLALAAFVFMPAMLGNTPLAALDLGAAAFSFIALYHLVRLRERPTHGRTAIAGVTFGLAQLTKFSNLLMVPAYAAIALFDCVRERSARPMVRLLAVFLVAFTTMFLVYGCEMRTVESVRQHPRFGATTPGEVFDWPLLRHVVAWFGDRPVPMLTYLKGIDYLKSKAGDEGHASYYRGESRFKFQLAEGEELKGWKTFYLTAMAVKTPVFLLILLVVALLSYPWLPYRPRANLPLLLFPGMLFVYFSLAPSQLGIRYVLPVLPPSSVLIGRLVELDPARRRRLLMVALLAGSVLLPLALAWEFRPERSEADAFAQAWLGVAVALSCGGGLALAWLARARTQDHALRRLWPVALAAYLFLGAGETLARHPDHLMFFNAFGGGPDNGWRILSVCDDWGQGASALAEFQRAGNLPEIRYDYYGTGIPEIYGLRYRPHEGRPVSGIVAVHVINLTRERLKGDGRYDWFDGLKPFARVGPILLFEVSEEEANRRSRT